jgi:uncharacterized membrane protein (UPF0127 family)
VTTARRAAVLAAGAVLLVVGIVVVVWRTLDDDSSPAALVSDVTGADAPFRALTAGTIEVGGRTVDVVVADDLDERIQGLRGRSDPSPYTGMLFVFGRDSTSAFTMAGVPAPLQIAFFDERGRRVDEMRMAPCAGTDASCPTYESSAPYRYVLETAPGDMPSGRLRVRG